ncbi:aconitase X catalytic domain-containing protein [Pseudomonas sp. WHRI 8519]|uniref:aconitase X catalytic domain-containing protein n=1 Tax=Pseudomonas sp. WHRI 8519 TaxID=3162567 RepID=UPI0032EFA1B8
MHEFEGKIELSERDKAMLAGNEGRAAQIAIRIVIRIALIQDAPRLLDISNVHVGGSIYTGQASLKVIETLADLGTKVRVPTSINAISIDRQRWRDQHIDEEFAGYADRLASAFEKMGAKPIFSCTPYVFPDTPKLGDDIVWAESNAIVYSNSVLGARTNRHGDFLDICAAITGRAPACGLHLPENRKGNFVINVPPLSNLDSSFYAVLGYLIGKHAGNDIPVIQGIRVQPSVEDLKYLSSTLATSGAVGMFHMVGVTPEADSLEQALGGVPAVRTLDVAEDELQSVFQKLSTTTEDELDLVLLGSPHFTLGDFEVLAQLTTGKQASPDCDMLITTSQYVHQQARDAGYLAPIERFGARVSTDLCLCMLNASMFPSDTRTAMTNSGKFAHYGPGLVGKKVSFGSLKDCVESAVEGRRKINKPAWLN